MNKWETILNFGFPKHALFYKVIFLNRGIDILTVRLSRAQTINRELSPFTTNCCHELHFKCVPVCHKMIFVTNYEEKNKLSNNQNQMNNNIFWLNVIKSIQQQQQRNQNLLYHCLKWFIEQSIGKIVLYRSRLLVKGDPCLCCHSFICSKWFFLIEEYFQHGVGIL